MSSVKLLVRMGRENVALDPTATTGTTVSKYLTHETEINTLREVLWSERIAELVAEDLGLYAAVPETAWPLSLRWTSGAKTERTVNERQRLAVRKLLDAVSVSSPAKSSVIKIECAANRPELAQQIADSWAKIFLREHLRVTRTSGSYKFFCEQVASLEGQLEKTTKELKDIKNKTGLVTVAGQQKILEDQMIAIRALKIQNEASMSSHLGKIRAVNKTIDGISPESNMGQAFAGLRSEEETLNRQLASTKEEIERLNEQSIRIADLERQIAGMESCFVTYVEKREEARVHQSLEDQQISSVNVIQPANFPDEPSGPGRMLSLVAGLVVSIFAAAVAVLFAEYADRSLTTPTQVEDCLDLPVLVTIPRLSRRRLEIQQNG